MANILIVDDSITVVKFMEMILTAEGHSLAFALDGDEAISRLESDKFDLLILDVVMPGKNGYQLCREIKNNEQYKDIPVIMLSTKGTDSDKFWGMRQGANEYLSKPCNPETLVRVVNKYVGNLMSLENKRPADTRMLDMSALKEPSTNPFYRFNN
ncbi:MAG: response regulator [Dissulfurispiraceae bacterium]|jgi:twitching motility two-component system response regulator PilH